MGYEHADVINDNFDPVIGNLVYESGWCLKRGGEDKAAGSFDLTDNPSLKRYLFVD